MARRLYTFVNGTTAALTAAVPAVATGTAIKTMLQVLPTANAAIVEWGYSFTTAPTANVAVELLTTGTIAATVTAFGANDNRQTDDSTGAGPPVTNSTSGSGYTATAEGTITATRLLGYRNDMSQNYEKQFPLDREPAVVASDVLRIRVTTGTTINMTCYVVLEF